MMASDPAAAKTPGLKGVALFRVGSDHPGMAQYGTLTRCKPVRRCGSRWRRWFTLRGEVRRVEGQHADDAKRDSAHSRNGQELARSGYGCGLPAAHPADRSRRLARVKLKQRPRNARGETERPV